MGLKYQKEIYVQVALSVPRAQLFYYIWPKQFETPQTGLRVRVPFARGERVGVVMGLSNENSTEFKLKAVAEVLEQHPVLSEHMLSFVRWAAAYYHHPIGDVVQHCLPPALRRITGRVPEGGIPTGYRLSGQDRPKRLSAAAQRLYSLLEKDPKGCEHSVLETQHIQMRTLDSALKQGWVEAFEFKKSLPNPPKLTPEQQTVFDRIRSQKGFKVHCIEGVTGSGKTYIYAAMIHDCLKRKQQAVLLVPEIGLTEQNLNHLDQLCGAQRVCIHSALNEQERLRAWAQVFSGQVEWVVGTRSALFAPWKNLGCVIVDEAHDAAYKQQAGWRYSARDCAVMLGKFFDVPVILGTATPSLESLFNVQMDRYQHYQLTSRYAGAAVPVVRRIDMRGQKAPIAPAVCQAIEARLKDQTQVLVFINRRGFSPVLYCADCQWVCNCHRCDAKCVQHQRPQRMVCHQCGQVRSVPSVCPECQSDKLLPLGFGAQRIEDWLIERFPEARTIRVDRDSMRQKGQLSKTLSAIQRGEYDLIIGTQMLAKGHHWPQLTLVVMVDADGALYSPDFRSMERFAQLFVQVSGRAGRAKHPGEVLIQTHWPQDVRLEHLIQKGYRDFALELLKGRDASRLPPTMFMAYVVASGRQITSVERFLGAVQASIKACVNAQQVEVWGPMPTWVKQVEHQHRLYLMISAQHRPVLHQILRHVVPKLYDFNIKHKVKWHLDVDPIEIP